MTYSLIDKTILNIGFHSLIGQEMISSVEDLLLAKKTRTITIEQPIFLTGLARSGTSLLLRLLVKTNQGTTHTYRDMPFVLCPIFWKMISSNWYLSSEDKERSHKDGLKINFDSEEAFEEIIWKHFFKTKYSENLIQPIGREDQNDEFNLFFVNHIKKMMLKNNTANNKLPIRYISKNNANISRIQYISNIFKDAVFVVPVRNPVTHVRSLMNQHKNFSEIQSRDNFSKKYMDYLGHYEFGKSFKRINFRNKYEKDSASWPLDNEAFWIDYWCDAYKSLMDLHDKGSNIVFVIYEHLCNDPKNTLNELFSRLKWGSDTINDILPIIKRCEIDQSSPPIYQRALELYNRLNEV